jgi:hypothetical protein
VRGFEPKGKLCAKGSKFAMVDAWSLNPSGRTARSLSGRTAEGFIWIHEDVALGTGRSYQSRTAPKIAPPTEPPILQRIKLKAMTIELSDKAILLVSQKGFAAVGSELRSDLEARLLRPVQLREPAYCCRIQDRR